MLCAVWKTRTVADGTVRMPLMKASARNQNRSGPVMVYQFFLFSATPNLMGRTSNLMGRSVSIRTVSSIKWLAARAGIGFRLTVTKQRPFTREIGMSMRLWFIMATGLLAVAVRDPSGGSNGNKENDDPGRGSFVHGPGRLAVQGLLCLRQRRLRESADPRRIRRLWREPGTRRTQLRHPQGDPRNSARIGGPKGSVVQRVGDFYASGMDEAAIDREGLRPLAPWLTAFRRLPAPRNWLRSSPSCRSRA